MRRAGGENPPERSGAPPAVRCRRGRAERPGTILVVTMWIMLALAGLVLVLAQAMRVEVVASANESSSMQAQAVEYGAIQYVLDHTDSLQGRVPTDTDAPCQAVHVGQGAFWIIRPNFEDDRTYAYGIVDEASKLNLNTGTLAMLSKLPDMTDELAACIVDWRDTDSNVTPGGVESEYYLLLNDPYQCKNAPLETVEELFLVKGAGKEIIFGEDANRNGVLDDNENDGDVSEPPDNRDGRLDRGLAPFVTVYSVEPNTSSTGEARVNVSDAGPGLADLLGKNLSADRATAVMARARRERPFRNVLDFYARTGLTASEFQALADKVTTASETVLRGLVNVNTAPREVLACLPGLADGDVSALLTRRADSAADLTSIAWVVQALSAEKAAAIGGLITARSYCFSADIVSVAGDGRAFKRCRIVVDARGSPPEVIYRQDLTHLGWPLARDTLATLRAGGSLEAATVTNTLRQEVAR